MFKIGDRVKIIETRRWNYDKPPTFEGDNLEAYERVWKEIGTIMNVPDESCDTCIVCFPTEQEMGCIPERLELVTEIEKEETISLNLSRIQAILKEKANASK